MNATRMLLPHQHIEHCPLKVAASLLKEEEGGGEGQTTYVHLWWQREGILKCPVHSRYHCYGPRLREPRSISCVAESPSQLLVSMRDLPHDEISEYKILQVVAHALQKALQEIDDPFWNWSRHLEPDGGTALPGKSLGSQHGMHSPWAASTDI